MSETPYPTNTMRYKIPENDDRERLVCEDCGYIAYENPKIVVGAVCAYKNLILLCKRAIEPRTGYWTMPAGYMELGENLHDGAKREAYEEAGVDLDISSILAIYSLPHINQVQIFYKASLEGDYLNPGPESLEARFFEWDDIPWDNLAFPTVKLALQAYKRSLTAEVILPDQRTIETSDPSAL